MTPVLSPEWSRLGPIQPRHSADNALPWCVDPARVRGRGQTDAAGWRGRRTPWRAPESGQTSTLAGGPMTSLRKCAGERGLAVSRGRHGGRGLWAVACCRQPEVPEDPMNDGGDVDGGEQLHPAGAAQTAQDVELEGLAHQPGRAHNLKCRFAVASTIRLAFWTAA